MEYKNMNHQKGIYVMANPDIPRIRNRVDKVADSRDVLGFIRFWVQEDQSIKVEGPEKLEEQLRWLGISE